MCSQQSLIDINISGLKEGLHLLSLLDQEQYRQGYKPAFQSDIGTHFRHILEHYRCFFEQLSNGAFRYDLRPRDCRLESDIDYAKETVNEILSSLSSFDLALFDCDYTLGEEYSDGETESLLINEVGTTLAREFMFLHSHTVHHYAMIAAMTRMLGLEPDADFGVAIPTRIYTRQLDQEKQIYKTKVKSTCAQ